MTVAATTPQVPRSSGMPIVSGRAGVRGRAHVPGAVELPGLDPAWSRRVRVTDSDGVPRSWHVLDARPAGEPVGTLLCVHGNPTWSYLWRRVLAAPPPGWRVVAPDQLGMGLSDRLDAPRPLAQRIDDLGRLTAAIGLTGPVVTLAHDWGGPVSLGWALAHPEQLAGVVLCNTAVHQPGGRGPTLIRLAHSPVLRDLVCERTPLFVRGATALSRPSLVSPPSLPREVRRAFAVPYAGAPRRRSVADFVADIPFAAGHPSRAVLDTVAAGVRGLDAPALLLWGPRDPVFGEAHLADLVDRLPRADVHRFEGASHLLPEDAPDYVDVVTRWVGDLDLAGAGANGHSRADGHSQSDGGPSPADGGPARPPVWAPLRDRSDDTSTAVADADGTAVSWARLADRVAALAAGFAAEGVGPGDRVALLVPPSVDLTTVVYALWRAGVVVVVVDRGLGIRAMGRALRGARVDHVVGSPLGLVVARAMRVPGRRFLAGAGGPWLQLALGDARQLTDVARRGREVPMPAEPAASDECAVVFTSGATGPAKGVLYRHGQVAAQLALLRTTYGLTEQDRIVAAFAPFALLGPALGVGSTVPDMDVTAPGTLTATALADAARSVDATVVFASPAALRSVLATAGDLSGSQRAALGRVRLLMSAGAPVPVALLRELRALVPSASLHTPYGMTEALPVTDVSLTQLEEAGSGDGVCVGWPLAGVGVAVSALSHSGTADAAPSAEPGVTGEICVRGEHVKDRYDALWATERRSSRDAGWHRTGDVGHLDPRGRLWVQGRLVHVVTTVGGPVTPVAPEQRVEGLAGVRAAAVVGVGPAGTQQVVVVVVPAGEGPARSVGRRSPLARSLPARSPLADVGLVAQVRAVAGVDVAAVLAVPSLPVDVRHASKVDRARVGRWAAGVLAGERG